MDKEEKATSETEFTFVLIEVNMNGLEVYRSAFGKDERDFLCLDMLRFVSRN